MGHDVVVVGASAGGIEALTKLLGALPSDLAACLLVVQHVSAARDSPLPRILQDAGTLPVTHAHDGDPLRHGHVYLAPRDRHLVLDGDRVRLTMGPKENNFRPAIDPLFRSAAWHHGPRVVAVVLSGALDCGSAGVVAVKRRGGVAVAQDPAEALIGNMPRNAIETGCIDHTLPVADIARLLVTLSRTAPRPTAQLAGSLIESELCSDRMKSGPTELRPGVPTALTCPSCNGPLNEIVEGPQERFRCLVGHAFGSKTLAAEQAQATEGAFWAALRAVEEQAALAQRLSERARAQGHARSAARFAERAATAREHARIVREELLRALPPRDTAEDDDLTATGDS